MRLPSIKFVFSRWSATRRPTGATVLGTVLIILIWGGVIAKCWENVRSDARDAARYGETLGILFEENILRSLGEIDKALLYLRRTIESQEQPDYHAIVHTTDLHSDIIVQVAVIDRDGFMRASSASKTPVAPINLADRPHFKAHASASGDHLYISPPMIGRASGKWSVQITRRFSRPNGTFGGVVVASMDPTHFMEFYASMHRDTAGAVAIIGSDGVVRAGTHRQNATFALGAQLSGSPLFAKLHDVRSMSSFEESGELMSVRKVKRHPLWIVVSAPNSEIYADTVWQLKMQLPFALIMTLLLVIALRRIHTVEERAAEKTRQLEITLEHMSQGIMLVTPELDVPIFNQKCLDMLELPVSLVEGSPRFDRIIEYMSAHGEFDAAVVPSGRTPLQFFGPEGVSDQYSQYERTRPNGTVLETRTVRLADGGFVRTFSDVTQRHEAQEHVVRLAAEDALTGLPNRRSFLADLERIQRGASAGKVGSSAQFAVLCLDLDRFKIVNDTLGHAVGDMLLMAVATRLRSSLRPTDVVARMGGDEFAILLPTIRSRRDPEVVARRLVDAVARPYAIEEHQVVIGVSVGVAIYPCDAETPDDLLVAADLALYKAKSGGRGAHCFFERSLTETARKRRDIEMDMRGALDTGQFLLHYQPIIELANQRIVGCEALVRWQHPTKGMISPADFIPIAEDSALILPLGLWVLTEACRQAATWPAPMKIAVNLSPVQFTDPNLVETVQRVLAETGLEPHRLELEITETIMMADNDRTLRCLHGLKQLGIWISMDDFGTGYSSLSYLRSFPFDRIKIDRAFVADLEEQNDRAAVVRAVIDIARSLGMRTTAEGVETLGQRNRLLELGCDEAQGYLFSRPVPTADVSALITGYRPAALKAA